MIGMKGGCRLKISLVVIPDTVWFSFCLVNLSCVSVIFLTEKGDTENAKGFLFGYALEAVSLGLRVRGMGWICSARTINSRRSDERRVKVDEWHGTGLLVTSTAKKCELVTGGKNICYSILAAGDHFSTCALPVLGAGNHFPA